MEDNRGDGSGIRWIQGSEGFKPRRRFGAWPRGEPITIWHLSESRG